MFKDANGPQYRQNNADHTKRIQKSLLQTCKASFESVTKYITAFNLANNLKNFNWINTNVMIITIENKVLFMNRKNLNT